jgi:hypothetical protein
MGASFPESRLQTALAHFFVDLKSSPAHNLACRFPKEKLNEGISTLSAVES